MVSCRTCRFAGISDNDTLECRRYPPVIIGALLDDSSVASGWPVVLDDDFCGEFRPAMLYGNDSMMMFDDMLGYGEGDTIGDTN